MREQAMTEGQPWRLIVRFTIPILLGNLFQQFYLMADSFIISRYLGWLPFAGVIATSGMDNVIIGFATGMTAGFAIPIAQSFGAGAGEQVRKHYRHNLLLCLLISAALTAVSVTLVWTLLTLLRTPEDIFSYAQDYATMRLYGILAAMLYNYFANVLRALGDSRSPVNYLLVSSAVNIVLDYLLVKFTPMGVKGAALATVISQVVAVVLCVFRIHTSGGTLAQRGEPFHWDTTLAVKNLSVGFLMALQSSVISFGVVLIQWATNGMGATAVAAYGASQKIDGIAVEPLRSLGLTMTTYTAQNYGAKRHDRIRQGVRQCVWMSIGVAVAFGLIMFAGGRLLAAIFLGFDQPELLSMSHRFLIVHGSLYIVLALLFVWRYTLQGLGNTGVVVTASIMELLMRALSAFFLVPALRFNGACIETPLSWIGALLPVAFVWWRTAEKILTGGENNAQ